MNKDQAKGAAKEAAGAIQRGAGRTLGSPEHEAKGAAKELSGAAQRKMGDAKQGVARALDKALPKDRLDGEV